MAHGHGGVIRTADKAATTKLRDASKNRQIICLI